MDQDVYLTDDVALFCRRCGATDPTWDNAGQPCPKEGCGGKLETLKHWLGDDDDVG